MATTTARFDTRNTPTIDQVGIEERVARIKTRSIKKESKVQGMKLALSMIDLTTLEGADTPGKVNQMCYKAIHLHDQMPGLPTVAAVCVYPTLVKTAKKALGDSGVKVAAVATAFPSGQAPKAVKIADTKFAVNEGADEIDMVISRGHFHSGEYNFVFDEIAAVKEVCGKARLKVILETGELGTYDKVRLASDIAIAAGADFIKTSTGKISPAATMEVTMVMLHAIRDHYLRPGDDRHETRRRHPHQQASAALPNDGKRGTRPGMAKQPLVPFRGQQLRERHPDAVAEGGHGRYQSADYFSLD
jgi:deoxyribose-phosphate aldolase